MTTETNRSRAQLLEAHYQALVDAALQHEQVIEFLLNALREGGVNIGNCFGVGRGGKTKTHYDVLRVTMNYQGEILPASPTSPI